MSGNPFAQAGVVFGMRGVGWALAAGLLAGIAGAAPGAEPSLSLLALGDTGKRVHWPAALAPQFRVAEAMVAEDRRSPVDGIVLLGDNFYPDGLRDEDFKDRVRENLVRPYCWFVSFTPRGLGSLHESCPSQEAHRHPVPIYAVLGNHDLNERESPALQQRLLPEYVANWRMPDPQVEVYELGEGVSLIAFHSTPWTKKTERRLVKALRDAQGPWRILAAHHPMVDPGRGYLETYARDLGRVLERAGVPVQLFLAGHEHNLQVIEGRAPAPPLHVISGAGADVRLPEAGDPRRRFATGSLGFVRVDLLRGQSGERLQVSLHTVPENALGAGRRARVVSRWSVSQTGSVQADAH